MVLQKYESSAQGRYSPEVKENSFAEWPGKRLPTAKVNGHDSLAWLTGEITRLPATLDWDIDILPPHRWKPAVQPDLSTNARCRRQALTRGASAADHLERQTDHDSSVL